jgi:hypothetical protein
VTAPSTLPSTSIPPTTPSHTPPNSVIAFTGALLSQEWLAGVAALLLGAGLVVVARWRRSKPTVATRRSTDAGRGSLPPD